MTDIEKKTDDIHARIMIKCKENLETIELYGKLRFIIHAISKVMAEELDTLDRKKANYEKRKR